MPSGWAPPPATVVSSWEPTERAGYGAAWQIPLGAASRIRSSLAPDGTWMIVEPAAGDTVESNLNPVGRVFYGFSTFLCLPNAMSQQGGYALGAQAGEAAIRQVVTDAGFTRFRQVAQTPFNLVYEARP